TLPLYVRPQGGSTLVPDRGHPVVTVRSAVVRERRNPSCSPGRRGGGFELCRSDGARIEAIARGISPLASPSSRDAPDTACFRTRRQQTARRVQALAELDWRNAPRQCLVRSSPTRSAAGVP